MIDKNTKHELKLLYWDIAIARTLYETAIGQRRFEDANYYARCIEVASIRARKLLALAERRTMN